MAEPAKSWSAERLKSVVRKRRGIPDFSALRRQGMLIGQRVTVESDPHLEPSYPWLVEIGDDVTMSYLVSILAHDASTYYATGLTRLAPVRVGSRVFIGAGATILPGTQIGDDCIIGAGAVVKGNIPENSVVVGSPAQIVGRTDEYNARHAELAVTSPRWSMAEGTAPNIGDAERAQMRDALREKPGYIGTPKSTVHHRSEDRPR